MNGDEMNEQERKESASERVNEESDKKESALATTHLKLELASEEKLRPHAGFGSFVVTANARNISSTARNVGGISPTRRRNPEGNAAQAGWPQFGSAGQDDVVRLRLNTDGNVERRAGDHDLPRRKRNASWDASSLRKRYDHGFFDLDILTKTSFAFDRNHQVHIPDEEDDDELAVTDDLEQFVIDEEEEEGETIPTTRFAREVSLASSHDPLSPHSKLGQKQPWFRWKLFWAYTGPGWLMSVAYLDPGNIESDLQAGGYSGYQLLWVLSVSTLLGFFLQTLAARLGVATGKNLAENCRDYYGKTDTLILYSMMQLAIIGSDIQEIVGSAIAFRVLFDLPLWVGCLITGLDTLTFLGLHIIGVRQLELFFVFLILAMCFCFFATFFSDPADPKKMVEGFFVPYVHDQASVQAVSILGAVVMPHNIYLHSALVLSRDIDRRRESKVAEANKYFTIEAGLALFVSLLINCAVVAVFAHGFYSETCQGVTESLTLHPSNVVVDPPFACVPKGVLHHSDPETQTTEIACRTESGVEGTCMPIGLQGAARALQAFVGKGASVIWAIGLLAAGQSSTMTGTYAGQFVMEGFLQLEIPNWVRVALTRAISLIPATIVAVLANSDYLAADRLDESLNVLQSLQLPFALLPLLCFTSSERFMGSFANGIWMRTLGWVSSGVVICINVYLVINSVDFAAMSILQLILSASIAGCYTFFVGRLALNAWQNAHGQNSYEELSSKDLHTEKKPSSNGGSLVSIYHNAAKELSKTPGSPTAESTDLLRHGYKRASEMSYGSLD